MVHATDIVGYTFDADIYCPPCVIEALIARGLASPAARDMDAETALDQIADSSAIDRYDESSYDSGEFPKVIFASQVEDPEHCGHCREAVV